jgi:hypothetical protein
MDKAEIEQPQKPVRGSWHEQAREMRAAGLAYHEIGRRLGVSGPACYFALNPGKRWKGKKKVQQSPVLESQDGKE